MFISFSGIDSAGKSTQIENLQNYFNDRGKPNTLRWSRGGYSPGINLFKSMIRLSPKKIIPSQADVEKINAHIKRPIISRIWLNIAILDLILYYGIWFRLLLLRYEIVIADRYIWDSLIDFKLKFSHIEIESLFLWKLLTKVHKRPDESVILTLNIEESLARSIDKKEPFMESVTIRQSRIKLYYSLMNHNKWKHIIDGAMPIDNVFFSIIDKIDTPPSHLNL